MGRIKSAEKSADHSANQAKSGLPHQSRSWLSQDVFLYFGDSLFDAGNVLRYGYPTPSERVLGESVGEALGDAPEDVLLSLQRQAPTSFKSSLNFAAWGATTDFGSALPQNPGQLRPQFDLLDQIAIYSDYLAATKPKKSVRLSRDTSALISAGGNDLLAFVGLYESQGGNLADETALTGFLTQFSQQTVANLQKAVAELDPLTDYIALLGPGGLAQTPYIQFLDAFKGAGGAIIAALDTVTGRINNQLQAIFDNPLSDVEKVTVVDGIVAFNNALDAFLADGFAVAQFWEPTPVTGSVHPSTLGSTYLAGSVFDAGSSQYAQSVVGQILADIPEFQA